MKNNPFEKLSNKINPTLTAVIREDECIGCTKCIQACPFDSIIGASKLMHTVLIDACTGCELCIEPCPVDCIDMVKLPQKTAAEEKISLLQFQERFEKRNARLENNKKSDREKYLSAKKIKTIDERKAEIKAALERARKVGVGKIK